MAFLNSNSNRDNNISTHFEGQETETVSQDREFQDPSQYTQAEPQKEQFADTESVKDTRRCTIADTQTPILVLFGPSQCGKSMTLVRLARYLRNVLSYNVEPRRDFRPSDDLIYQKRCDSFNNTINTYTPLPGGDLDEYMLCSVSDRHGNSKFQILEGPGEHYFSLVNPNPSSGPFPFYLNEIKNNRRIPKTWCFFLEPDWKERRLSAEYVARIKKAQSFINLRKDRIIFLYNKIDMKPEFIKFGKINFKALTKFAAQQYPGLFDAFKNDQLFFNIIKPYLFEFVPFSTGDFSDGTFVESQDSYPAALLKVIKTL